VGFGFGALEKGEAGLENVKLSQVSPVDLLLLIKVPVWLE
jgi:hypothetical protein